MGLDTLRIRISAIMTFYVLAEESEGDLNIGHTTWPTIWNTNDVSSRSRRGMFIPREIHHSVCARFLILIQPKTKKTFQIPPPPRQFCNRFQNSGRG